MAADHQRVLALAEAGDWPAALALVEQNAALAQAQDDFGMLPLHWACTEATTSLDTVKTLVAAFPGACRLENLSGMLPLHVALRNKLPGLHVRELLDAWPSAALAKDGNGRFPIDLAVASSLPRHTVDLIRQAGARAVRSASRSQSFDECSSLDNQSTSGDDDSLDAAPASLSKPPSLTSLATTLSRQGSTSSAYAAATGHTAVSRQLQQLLSQLQQLSNDLRKSTSTASSTYRSSFSDCPSDSSSNLISVLWNPSDKFGFIMEPADSKGTGARIKQFTSRSDVLGVEALRVGDVLVNISGAAVAGASFASIMRFLKHAKGTCKLRFMHDGPVSNQPLSGKWSLSHSQSSQSVGDQDEASVAALLEATLKKVAQVEETVRLSSAMAFCP